MKKNQRSNSITTAKMKSAIKPLFGIVFCIVLLLTGLLSHQTSAQTAEAMQEAEQVLEGLSSDFSGLNDKISQVASAYENFRDCVKGSGDVGKECQQYIDLLYTTAGGGIELQDQVMEGKQIMEEMLKQFEESGVYEQLSSAKKIFGVAGTALSTSKDALEFANKFNPEGARGDPTRGLNLIGEAIGESAGKLPYPMNEIFKGYAEAVTGISKQLIQLQGKLENVRQGNLGGSYADFADAQTYFENRFRGLNGRDTDLYFNVSLQFPLLGRNVQVFKDLINLEGEYYIYEYGTDEIAENGWIAPSDFAEVYKYFAVLPPSLNFIPPALRVQRLVAQASTNPGTRIATAKNHYQDFLKAKAHYNTERLLNEMKLLPALNTLLSHSEEIFVGLWLFNDEKRNEIQQIADALALYVYVEGTVVRELETGIRQPAPGEPVILEVEEGGRGTATTDEKGSYFVYGRGKPQLTFSLKAGKGEDTAFLSSRFLSRGFDDIALILKSSERTPVAILISPENATLEVGEMITFQVFAIFENDSSLDITNSGLTSFSSGSNSFAATEETEPGEHIITVTYMNLSATSIITVIEKEGEEEGSCGENETWDDELKKCVCIDGFEWIEDLGRCVSLDEAIKDLSDENRDTLCNEELMAEKLARLREIIAESMFKSTQFSNLLAQFMKAVNEKSTDPCHNQIIATAYSGAKKLEQELLDYENEITEISTDLILEAALCGNINPDFETSSIIGLVGQFGPYLNTVSQGISLMESELLTFGCNQQDVADRGDAVAEITADPEIISGLGSPGTDIQPPGQVTGGTMGVVLAAYAGGPLSSLSVSVNFPFRSYNFMLANNGQQEYQIFENDPLKAGDRIQIRVNNTPINASITLLSSDFIWIDLATNQPTSPGNGKSYFTLYIVVYFDDDEDVNRYRMVVGIGTLGMGIPGFPDGYGRELNF